MVTPSAAARRSQVWAMRSAVARLMVVKSRICSAALPLTTNSAGTFCACVAATADALSTMGPGMTNRSFIAPPRNRAQGIIGGGEAAQQAPDCLDRRHHPRRPAPSLRRHALAGHAEHAHPAADRPDLPAHHFHDRGADGVL